MRAVFAPTCGELVLESKGLFFGHLEGLLDQSIAVLKRFRGTGTEHRCGRHCPVICGGRSEVTLEGIFSVSLVAGGQFQWAEHRRL